MENIVNKPEFKNFHAVYDSARKTILICDSKENAEKRKSYDFQIVCEVFVKTKTKKLSLTEAYEKGYTYPTSHFSLSDYFYLDGKVYLNGSKWEYKNGYSAIDWNTYIQQNQPITFSNANRVFGQAREKFTIQID